MSNIKFKVDDYVNFKYLSNDNDNLTIEEVDELEKNKDTFRRNIRNLLKNFNKEFNISTIKFDTNIFNYFPLYQLENEEIYEFIDHMLALKSKEELVGNKLIANMKKINIDSVEIKDIYIKQPIESNFQETQLKANKEFQNIIRRNLKEVKLVIENFDNLIKDLKKSNNPADLMLITSLTFNIISQMITYWCVCFTRDDKEKRIELANEINQYLIDFDTKVENDNDNIKIELYDAIIIFTEFLKSYNYCGEYIKIMKILQEEELNSPQYFNEIDDKYKVTKGTKYNTVKYKDIITEGENIYEFRDKFNKTQKTIKIFNNKGIKTFSDEDVYDLKVFFREIYISDSKYKSKASTIVRKMTEKSFDQFEKTSDFMFLREKITRGCFRELFPIELYRLRSNIHEQLYISLFKITLCYNYQKSLDYFNQLVTDLTPLCYRLYDNYLDEKGENKIF